MKHCSLCGRKRNEVRVLFRVNPFIKICNDCGLDFAKILFEIDEEILFEPSGMFNTPKIFFKINRACGENASVLTVVDGGKK